MTIYEELLLRTEQGEKFHIDFEKRNMKVGKDWLIKNGECETGRILYGYRPVHVLELIEDWYEDYKYSCPSEMIVSEKDILKHSLLTNCQTKKWFVESQENMLRQS